MEIRHIPGKVNPADTLTRQVKVADDEYAGEVKQLDRDFVNNLRIPKDATDVKIQPNSSSCTILMNSSPSRVKLYSKFWQRSLRTEMQFWQCMNIKFS